MTSNLYIKNIHIENITILNVTIIPNDTYLVSFTDLFEWARSAELINLIIENKVTVSDGVNEYSNSAAFDYVKSLQPKFVITRFERDDRVLKGASAQSEVNIDTGIAIIEIDVPISSDRTIAGGESWFVDKHKDDRITNAEIFTRNDIPIGIFGPYLIPSGTVLETYHDQELPIDNQGYRIPFVRGLKEIETIAGYGTIPKGLSIRIIGKKGGSAPFYGTFYVNIEWGKKGAD